MLEFKHFELDLYCFVILVGVYGDINGTHLSVVPTSAPTILTLLQWLLTNNQTINNELITRAPRPQGY